MTKYFRARHPDYPKWEHEINENGDCDHEWTEKGWLTQYFKCKKCGEIVR